MGLSAQEWLSIALFCAATSLGWAGFLLQRWLRKTDKHEAAIYGENGLFAKLLKCVTREVHDVANAELAVQMDRLRHEGMQREDRILDAIRDSQKQNTSENGALRTELRGDISKVVDRFDRLQERVSGQPPTRRN